MGFTFFEGALEAEQSSDGDQSFFLKHPVLTKGRSQKHPEGGTSFFRQF